MNKQSSRPPLSVLERNIAERRGFKPKNFESFPEIVIRYVNMSHITPGDARALRAVIESSDGILMEDAGRNAVSDKNLRSISEATVPADVIDYIETSVQTNEFVREFNRVLYGTHKPIGSMDFSVNDAGLMEMAKQVLDSDISFLHQPTLEKTVDAFRERMKMESEFNRTREELIVSKIPLHISKMLAQYPILKKQKKITLALIYGATHVPMKFDIQKVHKNITNEYTSAPFIFSHSEECKLRFRLNKKVSNELVTKALIEFAYGDEIDSLLHANVIDQSGAVYSKKHSREYIDGLSASEIAKLLAPFKR